MWEIVNIFWVKLFYYGFYFFFIGVDVLEVVVFEVVNLFVIVFGGVVLVVDFFVVVEVFIVFVFWLDCLFFSVFFLFFVKKFFWIFFDLKLNGILLKIILFRVRVFVFVIFLSFFVLIRFFGGLFFLGFVELLDIVFIVFLKVDDVILSLIGELGRMEVEVGDIKLVVVDLEENVIGLDEYFWISGIDVFFLIL